MMLMNFFRRLLCFTGMNVTPKTSETIPSICSSGMETPSLSIKAKSESVVSQVTVSTATENKVLSTSDLMGDQKVSLTLTSIAAFISAIDTSELVTAIGTVATVVQGTETVINGAEQLIAWVKTYMAVVEQAYSTSRGAGAAKLAAVLAAAKAASAQLGVDWDTVKSLVTAWINSVVALWNAVNASKTAIESVTE